MSAASGHPVTSGPCDPKRSDSFAQRPIRGVEGPPRSPRAVWAQLFHAAHIALAILREVFDESAYARFLSRTQSSPSKEAYAAFCQENELTKLRRQFCC
jgi:hypothetical protein